MTDHKRGIEAAKKAFYRNMDPGLGVEEAISAYLAITEPGKPESGVLAVKVKPLLWEDELDISRAQTNLVACYSVWDAGDHWECSLLDGKFKDVDAAKAAAEADYEQRVMSALSTPPQPVEAHKKLELWFFRDMFESNRLALFSLFGFKAEHVDTMAKQQKSFRHILRNEGAK